MYASSTTLASVLKVVDNRQSGSDTLVDVIKFSRTANLIERAKAPLLTYLSSCKNMNQRELCGLLRHLVTIRLAASSSACVFLLEAMRCLKRLQMDVKEKATVDVVRTLFDEALVGAYGGMRREGIPTSHFGEVHGGIGSILRAKGSWLPVLEQLKVVTQASELGSNNVRLRSSGGLL